LFRRTAHRLRSHSPRRLRLAARVALGALAALALAPPAAAAGGRAVVLGFDGADARLAARWMDEGQLPNLAKLRAEGTFAPLRSTVPSQTPVSWSTFSTGLNPGRHAIFDFLKRDTATYRPSFAAFDQIDVPFLWGGRNALVFGLAGGSTVFALAFLLGKLCRARTQIAALAALAAAVGAGLGAAWVGEHWIPVKRPQAVNRRQGDPFWKVLGEAGKRVKVFRVPVTFPPEPFAHGELLSGLGTPDLSGRIGKPFFFTSELFWQPKGDNEVSIEVVELIDNRGTIPAEIVGPPNKLFPGGEPYVKIPITLTVVEDRSALGIEVSGARLTLRPGEWSDWVRFVFPFNPLVEISGIGRFRLLALDPEVELYLSPIQFDPSHLPPALAITAPGELAEEMAARFGLFKTIGWMIDTWSIKAGSIDDDTFFQDVDQTLAKELEIADANLAAGDWDVYLHYFEFTDRVQHVMWRHTDPQHPLYTEEGNRRHGDSILEAYRQMDRVVGRVRERMPADAALFVVSDHGFAPWRRIMNYNTWLAENGYLWLKGQVDTDPANLQDLFDQSGQFFSHVDWSRTRAYAMGLGNVYVNLAGREAQGIVKPGAEYEALVAELKAKLPAYVDPETGEKPVAYVFSRDEAYGTYDPALIPDLFPANALGYRVGWQDALGRIAQSVTEPNLDVWSADHCSVYPPLVDGILFSNRKLSTDPQPYMADVMPTLLALYGVAPPVELDGRSLLPGS
jgi:predicted AlkP superfamily phosphohydrolase/phosphomutase